MTSDRETVRDEPHAATPSGWSVGTLPRLLLCTMFMGLLTACASAAPPAADSPPATGSPPGSTSPEASLEAPGSPDGRPVDLVTAELLRRYGLLPSGPTTISTTRIESVDEQGWDIVLEASREIGLDFAGLEGRDVQMRSTPVVGNLGPQHECVGCSKGGQVHVLVAGGRLVGAWLSDRVTVPGVYALSEAEIWCRDDQC